MEHNRKFPGLFLPSTDPFQQQESWNCCNTPPVKQQTWTPCQSEVTLITKPLYLRAARGAMEMPRSQGRQRLVKLCFAMLTRRPSKTLNLDAFQKWASEIETFGPEKVFHWGAYVAAFFPGSLASDVISLLCLGEGVRSSASQLLKYARRMPSHLWWKNLT